MPTISSHPRMGGLLCAAHFRNNKSTKFLTRIHSRPRSVGGRPPRCPFYFHPEGFRDGWITLTSLPPERARKMVPPPHGRVSQTQTNKSAPGAAHRLVIVRPARLGDRIVCWRAHNLCTRHDLSSRSTTIFFFRTRPPCDFPPRFPVQN